MNVIRMEHVGYQYPSHIPEGVPVQAVSEMCLTVEEGSYWVILGRNGSGKSTLTRLMNALLLPSEGIVLIDGMETRDEAHLWQIRKTVGVVFQNPDNQIVATTVEEDVAFGPENLGIAQAEIRIRVDEALQTVGMTPYVEHSPHMLSGGQKQRVAIAGILAMKPKCIVLDEATSMLDPEGRQEVLKAMKMLHQEHHMTIVLITHHMEEAVEADCVMVMQGGKKILSGTPSDVFQKTSLLREAGLDVPQVTSFWEHMASERFPIEPLPVYIDEAEAIFQRLLLNSPAYARLMDGDDTAFLLAPVKTLEKENIIRHPYIRIRDLRHVYMPDTQYERIALDGVSLDIFQGEIMGVIGHTGSGKSTFVQHLNGLLKATSGTLEVGGVRVDAKNLKALRKKVGLIFQYPEHQLFEETVYKDIAFGLIQNGLSLSEVDVRVQKVSALLSITPEMLVKSPFELSGGQKRRVAIAGVLAMEPAVLILDEPTAGLDPKGSKKVLQLLKELNEKEGTTIILISHNMEDIAAYAQRVAVFREGRLALLDEPKVIFGQLPLLQKMHLTSPAITRLFLSAGEKIGVKLPTILTVEEAVVWMNSLYGETHDR